MDKNLEVQVAKVVADLFNEKEEAKIREKTEAELQKAASSISELTTALEDKNAEVAEMEETGEVSDAVVKAMGAAEMMAITIPEEHGGLGLGYTERMLAVEEVSRVSVAAAMMLQVFALGIEPIVKFGTDELKKKSATKEGRVAEWLFSAESTGTHPSMATQHRT